MNGFVSRKFLQQMIGLGLGSAAFFAQNLTGAHITGLEFLGFVCVACGIYNASNLLGKKLDKPTTSGDGE